MNALTIIHRAENLPGPVADIAMAHDFAKNEKAAATRRAHGADSDAFVAWCSSRSPAFSAAEAARGIKPASIGRRGAAIRYAHKPAGISEPPTNSEAVKATVRGIRPHARRGPGPQGACHRRPRGGDGDHGAAAP